MMSHKLITGLCLTEKRKWFDIIFYNYSFSNKFHINKKVTRLAREYLCVDAFNFFSISVTDLECGFMDDRKIKSPNAKSQPKKTKNEKDETL